MKITSLSRNGSNQIIAEVLECGRQRKIFSWTLDGLVDTIYHECKFASKDDIKLDLESNYADFK